MSRSICSTGLRWLWLVVVVLIIIDLGSKYLILRMLCCGDTVPLFPSLNLHYARNYGAAFSFLADSGGWQRWFFAGIAIGISVDPGSDDVSLEGHAEAKQYRLCADYWRRAGQPVRPPVARLHYGC